ncbi:polysaccharide deacetylase family protein [Dactylosporangium sp. NPDC051484]|uniref:polysaccharide deacetylase family protein n=1 Tax=Dactylosporangium sp. NPDC051484 TaxID=3154942 RepID=UPI00344B2B97
MSRGVFKARRTVSRRSVLLALGGASLLAACGPDKGAWHAGGELPGDSHSGEVSADPMPSVFPSVAPPTPGQCPPITGAGTPRHGGPQYYLPCKGTQIALTVDDGPDPQYTPHMLALLAKYDIRATFCMIGRSAAAHPDLVKQVVAGGHHIANHTYTHPLNLTKQPAAQIRAELHRASEAISNASGGQPTLFRAPGGAWSDAVLSECGALGMRPLDWSVDPRDWSRPGVQHIVDTILTRTRPGAIILEHDGGGNRDQTVSALTIALPRLLDAGYAFAQP